MKRFLVFKFDQYYPSGGMDDFVMDTNDIIEAVLFCVRYDEWECNNDHNYIYDTWQRDTVFSYEIENWESPEEKAERIREYNEMKAAGLVCTTSSFTLTEKGPL